MNSIDKKNSFSSVRYGKYSLQKIHDKLDHLWEYDPPELMEMLYSAELGFGFLIRNSDKESTERRELFAEAWKVVTHILSTRRRKLGIALDSFGFSPTKCADKLSNIVGPPPKRIFDVGCGTGFFVQLMKEKGYHAKGVDVSEEFIEIGKKRMADLGICSGGETILYAQDFLGFDISKEKESYDLVCCNDVLEHIPADEANDFLRRCNYLLKPGGYLWLVTGNKLFGPGDATVFKCPKAMKSEGLDLGSYSLRELSKLIRSSGFHRVSSCLWNEGRYRKRPSSHRVLYTKLKIWFEYILKILPFPVRRFLISIMSYFEVVAVKLPQSFKIKKRYRLNGKPQTLQKMVEAKEGRYGRTIDRKGNTFLWTSRRGDDRAFGCFESRR